MIFKIVHGFCLPLHPEGVTGLNGVLSFDDDLAYMYWGYYLDFQVFRGIINCLSSIRFSGFCSNFACGIIKVSVF